MQTPKFPLIVVVVTDRSTEWEVVKAVNAALIGHGVSAADRRAFWTEALALNNEHMMGEIARRWVEVRPTNTLN